MKIFIKSNGATTDLVVNPSDTVADVKKQLGRESSEQLIFKGELLENGRALSSYDMKDGDIVLLGASSMASVVGGGAAKPSK